MWIDYLEDVRSLNAIYGDHIPSLKNVLLHEIKIVTGIDIQCYVRFDLATIPLVFPRKWASEKVNAVQIDMCLMSSQIDSFKAEGGEMLGDIQIELEGNSKSVVFVADGKIIFKIRSKWISVRSITGYLKDGPDVNRT